MVYEVEFICIRDTILYKSIMCSSVPPNINIFNYSVKTIKRKTNKIPSTVNLLSISLFFFIYIMFEKYYA